MQSGYVESLVVRPGSGARRIGENGCVDEHPSEMIDQMTLLAWEAESECSENSTDNSSPTVVRSPLRSSDSDSLRGFDESFGWTIASQSDASDSGTLTPRSSILTRAKRERRAGYYYYKHVENPLVGAGATDNVGVHTTSVSEPAQLSDCTNAEVSALNESQRCPASSSVSASSSSSCHLQVSNTSCRQPSNVRDWNAEFQSIIDRLHEATRQQQEQRRAVVRAHEGDLVSPLESSGSSSALSVANDERLEVYTRLAALVQDFNYVAKAYGKVIILERYNPVKTIKPIEIGGIGGGEKYVAGGILFKFAVDKYGLYGDDSFSAKAAGNELKGLLAYYQAQVPDIHVPLMTLIDFRGFRLVAQSIAPIEKLVYGSDDGGSSVFADDELLNNAMKLAATRIGLKGHMAGGIGENNEEEIGNSSDSKRKPQFIYGPTDIEGHRGRDGRYYILDFARTMPPEAPGIHARRRSVLWQLLRPEFVSRYSRLAGGARAPQGLSSDALSGFGAKDPLAAEHNREVRQATHFMQTTCVPKIASQLDRLVPKALSRVRLTELVHKAGINMRHLGHIRACAREERVKTFLLMHMIARVVKCEVNKLLRLPANALSDHGVLGPVFAHSTQQPYKEAVALLFNVVLGVVGNQSDMWWRVHVKQLISEKYLVPNEIASTQPLQSLSSNELHPDTRLDHISRIDIYELFNLVQLGTRITVGARALACLKARHQGRTGMYAPRGRRTGHSNLVSDNDEACEGGFRFVYPDIEHLGVRIKDMNISSHAEGMALYAHSVRVSNSSDSSILTNNHNNNNNNRSPSSSSPGGLQLVRTRSSSEFVGNEASDRLFKLAMSKFESAAASMLDNHSTVSSWAEVLIAQSKNKTGKTRSKLVTQAIDRLQSIHDVEHLVMLGRSMHAQIHEEALAGPERELSYILASLAYGAATSAIEQKRKELAETPEIAHTHDGETIYRQHAAFEWTIEPFIFLQWGYLLCEFAQFKSPAVARDTLAEAGRYLLRFCRSWSPTTVASDININVISSVAMAGSVLCELICTRSRTVDAIEAGLMFQGLCRKYGVGAPSAVESSWFYPGASPEVIVDFLHSSSNDIQIVRLSGDEIWKGSRSPYSQSGNGFELLDTGLMPVPVQIFSAFYHPIASLQSLHLSDFVELDDENVTKILKGGHSQLFSLSIHCCPGVRQLLQVSDFDPIGLPSLKIISLTECRSLVDDVSKAIVLFRSTLEDLAITACKRIGEACFMEITRSCSNLRRLNASGTKSGSAGGKWLPNLARGSQRLEAIVCNNLAGFSATNIASICKSQPCFVNLQMLKFAGCINLTDNHLLALASGLSKIDHLELSHCKLIGDDGVVALVRAYSSIRTLCVNYCSRLSDMTLEALACSQSSAPVLQQFEGHNCFKFTNHGIGAMVRACGESLQILRLNGCDKFEDQGLHLVADCCPLLHTFSIGSAAATPFLSNFSDAAIARVAIACQALVKVDFSGCRMLGDLTLAALSTSEQLKLQALSLGWSTRFSAPALLSLVQVCSGSLTKIDLRHCAKQTTDAVICTIAAQTCSLEDLWLDSCQKITDSAMLHIGKYCSSLRSLRLASCHKVTDAGICAMAAGCPRILHLGLQRLTKLTDAAIVLVSEVCPLLRSILLNGCSGVTERSAHALVSGSPKISKLVFEGCRVSEGVISAILHSNPDIELRGAAGRAARAPEFRWTTSGKSIADSKTLRQAH